MAKPPPDTDIEVVIPHWNQADRLRHALVALQNQTVQASICVVDNGSTDHTQDVLSSFPEVRRVGLGENMGFGVAVNRGVETSDARLVVLLNNDTVADSRFIEEVASAQTDSGAEMISACLRSKTGHVESAGVVVDRGLATFDYLNGLRFEDIPSDVSPPLGPSGGAAAYVRAALLEVGGFDEEIFAYLEDVDLGIRMRMAGMKCAIAPRAFAWHEHSSSLGSRSSRKNELMAWSGRYLRWKYGSSVAFRDRVRRWTLDATVAIGKVVIDRNLGSLRGWRSASRDLKGRAPEALPGAQTGSIPIADISLPDAFRRRLARRTAL